MKYDPRNPPEEALLSVDNPKNFNLKKTVVLLKLHDVYFIVEGSSIYTDSYDDFQKEERWYYQGYTCPTIFIPIIKIAYDGDTDPHGLFKHIESIWMTNETLDNLDKIFPQILKKE